MAPKPPHPSEIKRLPVEIGIYETEGGSRLRNPDFKPGLWERLMTRLFKL